MDLLEAYVEITKALIAKSGVQEWNEPEKRAAIMEAAAELALHTAGEFMATQKVLVPEFDGTPAQITFRDSTDFGPTAANDLRHGTATDTEVQLDLTGVTNGAARQSAKFDLGAVRAPAYNVRCAFELAATPTAGAVVSLYVAPSQDATAGTGNPGAVSGADAAYTGYSSNLAASLKQLQYVGDFVCTAQATGTVQVAGAGIFVPRERYGSLVVVNNSGAAFHSDMVETHIVLDPVYEQIQAAV